MSRVRLVSLGLTFLFALGAVHWITRQPPGPAVPAAASPDNDETREDARKRLRSLGYLN